MDLDYNMIITRNGKNVNTQLRRVSENYLYFSHSLWYNDDNNLLKGIPL